jgi:integrase
MDDFLYKRYPQSIPEMKNKNNFTKAYIDALPLPPKGKRAYYRDSKVNGLEVMITSNGVKSFKVTKKKDGRIIRYTIGHYPDISIENARQIAHDINSQIAKGINPNEEKNKLSKDITFKNLFDEYIEKHAKPYKKSWKEDANQFNRYLESIANKKLGLITNEIVRKLYNKGANDNGIYAANRLLALLRVIFNKALDWGWEGKNPVYAIKKFKEVSRDRFLQPEELPRFFESLANEENMVARDYVYLSLYTGARKSNVLEMRWDEINFVSKEWKIPVTKNGECLTVPLVDEAIEVLNSIKSRQRKNEWVFPSATSQSGHLQDPKKAWQRILKRANISNLRLHDIRRTLGSYQAIGGSSLPIIGKSLGHKTHQATQIYSRMNLDPVRDSLNKAVGLMNSYKK